MMKWWGWGDANKVFSIDDKPKLWPFITSITGITQHAENADLVKREDIYLPAAIIHTEFLAELKQLFKTEQIGLSEDERLQHTYGRSYRDIIRARRGEFKRPPDTVVYPENHEQVVKLMQLANQYKIIIIPFGGATNIVGAVEVLPTINTMVICVDLTRMNKVLHIDKESMLATIEAGVLGPDLEAQLNQQGYSLGHFPDSFEFSTLGGWLATRSAGMQSDRYGKIEDMVISLNLVTPTGVIQTPTVPRAAAGPDVAQIIVGSEGVLGIITQATMQIHPYKPSEYRGVLFPNFAVGVKAIYDCMRNDCMPTTLRLSDASETAFSFAMRTETTAWKAAIQSLYMQYIQKFKGINLAEACLLIVGFEGEQIKKQKSQVMKIFHNYGAVDLGTSVGDKWYANKYNYPYIRDYLINYGVTGDVTETSVVWSKTLDLHKNVQQAMHDFYRQENIRGYLGCHLSHSYDAGVCLYFTFAFEASKDPIERYWPAKKASVDAVLKSGGSLSHHHGIGYEHQTWMVQYLTPTHLQLLRSMKANLDPNNICNPGKLLA